MILILFLLSMLLREVILGRQRPSQDAVPEVGERTHTAADLAALIAAIEAPEYTETDVGGAGCGDGPAFAGRRASTGPDREPHAQPDSDQARNRSLRG